MMNKLRNIMDECKLDSIKNPNLISLLRCHISVFYIRRSDHNVNPRLAEEKI